MRATEITDILFSAALAVMCILSVWDARRQSRRRREYDAIVAAVLDNRIKEAATLSEAYLARYGGSR
jgi:hypothetical protein